MARATRIETVAASQSLNRIEFPISGHRPPRHNQSPSGLDDVVTELSAQTGDNDLDRIGITVIAGIVQMFRQFSRGHDTPAMVHQVCQKPILERRQRNGSAAERNTHLQRVEKQRPGSQNRCRLPRRAPQQSAKARQQFFHLEGLGQIIVGAGIDAFDPFRPHSPGRQDEDRKPPAVGTPAFQDGEAIELGQAEIQYCRVIVLDVACEPGLLTVTHDIDGHS